MRTQLVFALTAGLCVQAASFEVATVKPTDDAGNNIEVASGTLKVHAAVLHVSIAWAYGLQRNQVLGDPNVLDTQRYEIVAKAAGPAPESEMRLMLQTLLAERFRLAAHKESRPIQAYALTVDKAGPKFQKAKDDGEPRQQLKGRFTRQWTSTSMALLIDSVSDAMQAPVIDETGLAGNYDFALDLTPYMPPAGERPDVAQMMVTAIREQLGLKLESRRAPIEVLVVDHIEKPSAN
jgi:uncharacterized protein (TIGR03435 family)